MKHLFIIIICIILFPEKIIAFETIVKADNDYEKFDYKAFTKKKQKIKLFINGKIKKVRVLMESKLWLRKEEKCMGKLNYKTFYKKKIIHEMMTSEAYCVNISGIGPWSSPKLFLEYIRPETIKYKVRPFAFDFDGIEIKTEGILMMVMSISTGVKKNLAIERIKRPFLVEMMKATGKSAGMSKEDIDSWIDSEFFKEKLKEIVFDGFVYNSKELSYQTSMKKNLSTANNIVFLTNGDEINFINEIINNIEASKNNDYPYSLTELEIKKIKNFEKIDLGVMGGFQPRN